MFHSIPFLILLIGEGVDAVTNETDPAGIFTQTHRWAVAEWLIHAGVNADQFPSEFRAETAGAHGLPELESVLNNTPVPEAIAEQLMT